MPTSSPTWEETTDISTPSWDDTSEDIPSWDDTKKPSAVEQRLTFTGELKKAGSAAYKAAKEFVPKSVSDVAGMVSPVPQGVGDIKQAYSTLQDWLHGKSVDESVKQNIPESQVLADADKTPAFSQERYDAAAKILLQMGMAAGTVKGMLAKAAVETPKPPVESTEPGAATPQPEQAETQPRAEPLYKPTPSGPAPPDFDNTQVDPQAVAEAQVESQGAIDKIKLTEPEQETTGVANRVFEDLAKRGQMAEIQPGEGLSTEDLLTRGRELKLQGADPQAIAQKFTQTGAVSPDEAAVVRAHMEDLHKAYREADRAREANPDSPKAIEDAGTAWNTFTHWAQNVMQPIKTKASDLFRGFQGEVDLNTGEFSDLRRYVLETKGRDINPIEEPLLRARAKTVKQAFEAEAQATKKLGDAIKKGPKPKVRTLEEKRAFIADYLRKTLPC